MLILNNKQAQAFQAACKATESVGRIAAYFDNSDGETFVKVYSEGDVMITRMFKCGKVEHEEYVSLEAFEDAYTFLL
jgi:hypothetical protein